jgi:hypothetical protein
MAEADVLGPGWHPIWPLQMDEDDNEKEEEGPTVAEFLLAVEFGVLILLLGWE